MSGTRTTTNPFLRPPSLDERITRLEVLAEHQADKNVELIDAVRGIRQELKLFNEAITTIAAQRALESKAADRWKNATITLLGGVALALLLWVARIAWIVQAARSAGGG